MKYQSSNTKVVYDISFDTDMKKRYHCPECSMNRKKAKNKDLEFYPDNGRAFCFHCQSTFFEYKPYIKKEYVLPEWKNKTELSDKSVRWFEGRMIKQETLIKMKVYSDTEYMPQFGKSVEVICFPYFFDGKLVNIKYRGPQKSFKLHSGSELVLWNIDCLKSASKCLICEGEIDALSYINAGFENTMSVPNGAGNNLDYLNDYIDLFKDLEAVYISTDNDTKGIELRDELVRRIGIEKCYIVNLRECKDANEFACKYSSFELIDCINSAKQLPIKGVIYADDIYNDLAEMFENGIKPGLPIGFREIDQFCTWETGMLCIATGEPNSGKSEVIDYIVSRLNLLYGWKAAYFTPENYPIKYHYSKIFEKLIGKPFKRINSSDAEFDTAFEYINSNYFYILNEEDLTPKYVIDTAKYLVKKEGIKILVIDPYNKLDHHYTNGQSETQYISKFLDDLKNFAKFNDVLTILVAHPAKLQPGQIPNLYTISGSANFYNKADYGFTFHRVRNHENVMTNESQIHWQKFRFKHLGSHGISNVVYNPENGRFEKFGIDTKLFDNSSWIQKIVTHNIEANYDFENEKSDDCPF